MSDQLSTMQNVLRQAAKSLGSARKAGKDQAADIYLAEAESKLTFLLDWAESLPDDSFLLERRAVALEWLSRPGNYGRQIQHWYGGRTLLDAIEIAMVFESEFKSLL